MSVGAGALAPFLPSRHTNYADVFASFWTWAQFSLCLAVVFFALGIWALRVGRLAIANDSVAVGRPGRWGMEWTTFERHEIVRFEVRRWVWLRRKRCSFGEPAEGRHVLSVLLTDGSWVQLLPFSRAPTAGGPRRHIHEIRGRWRRSTPWHDDAGDPVIWTEHNDLQIEHLFNALLGGRVLPEHRRTRSRKREGAGHGPVFDVHRRPHPVAHASERDWLSYAIQGRTDPPIVPPPTPPKPVRAPRPERPLAASLWDEPTARPEPGSVPDLKLPARYWTLASQRTGSLAGGPPSMTIDREGLHFARRLRRDLHVPLRDIDRFDIEFDGIDPRDPRDADERMLHGNWRLMLFRRDGSTVPLSGLDHGYFKQNQLYWSASGRAGRKLPQPNGSMPWPNDQPLEVAARLNAHLEVARAACGAARASA